MTGITLLARTVAGMRLSELSLLPT
jgi:hypothetical protein